MIRATDLFSFQNASSRLTPKLSLAPIISSWPTLPSDFLAASLKPPKINNQHDQQPEPEPDEIDDPNLHSILVVSDDSAGIHCFLDGSYPIGTIALPINGPLNAMYKKDDTLFMHSHSFDKVNMSTSLNPVLVRLPELEHRIVHDVARVASSMRELVWYTMRVVKEMRGVWFGSETQNGAREIGPKWIRALEARQKNLFGR